MVGICTYNLILKQRIYNNNTCLTRLNNHSKQISLISQSAGIRVLVCKLTTMANITHYCNTSQPKAACTITRA